MKSLLTIVIPCKNEERYIGALLEDLSNQRHIGDTRIIVADANSTDSTLAVVKRFQKKLNIEIITGGAVSVGRNNGAKLATTRYILFLDADVRLFTDTTIKDTLDVMRDADLDLMTLKLKNYGTDPRASFFFWAFNIFNKIMSKKTPFAIGAFFLVNRNAFENVGGFPSKYETSEDYILSKQFSPRFFRIGEHYFGQDERRFKKLGYWGMLKYMAVNFWNRNNLQHFEKANVNYWD